MSHRPIVLSQVAFEFPKKICFANFSAEIQQGDRIGIIGNNGVGKSHLLRVLCGQLEPTRGDVYLPSEIISGYVPQIISCFESASGGEGVNRALSAALSSRPNLLCLDEPTNHLDMRNRRSLRRMLQCYRGTLVIVTHDVELLEQCVHKLWHIADGRVLVTTGSYRDFVKRIVDGRRTLQERESRLRTEKRQAHQDLMRDQERAKKRRLHGEKKYGDDKLALRSAQGRGQLTTNKNRKRIRSEKDEATSQLEEIRLPEVLRPKFSLTPWLQSVQAPIASIREGTCGYDEPLLNGIHLQIGAKERVWLIGDNGSGKSTLVRAILQDPSVKCTGSWSLPSPSQIGYLDQHYRNLNSERTAIETIQECAPHWTLEHIRDHLNSFLFRKNEEVNLASGLMSGGEKARLSLAQIAAKTPKLLILDEMTNNLDLETRGHVIQVLRDYPGAMIVVSHDTPFAREISLTACYRTCASIDKTVRAEPFTNFFPQVVDVVLDVTSL